MIKRENTIINYNNKNLQSLEHVVDNLDQLEDILQNTTNENLEQKTTTDSKTKDHTPIKNTSSEDFSKTAIIKTTPLTRKRYKRNIKQKVNRTLNVTNLNILFDSSHINQNSNELLEKTPESRLYSKETITNNVSFVQSDDVDTKTNVITDTPKLSSRYSQLGYDNADDPEFLNISSSKSQLLHENIIYVDNNVNVNPYLKERDIKLVHKDNSLGDLSFISKDLHKVNSSSTPIERIDNYNALLKDLPIKEYPNNLNNRQNEKITNGYNNSFSNLTINNQLTASSKFDYNQSNCYNKTFTLSSPTTFYPKTYLDRVGPLSRNISKSNLKLRSYSFDTTVRCKTLPQEETLVDKLKKIKTISGQWTYGLFDLCAYIGLLFRKKISSICALYVPEKSISHTKLRCKSTPSSSSSSTLSTCRSCDTLKTEVNRINSKLDQLRTDITIFKKEMNDTYVDQVKQLENNINGLKNDFIDLKSIKSDLQEIKTSIVQKTTTNTLTTSIVESVPVIPSRGPPPPPPPPPPLPTLPLGNPTQNQLKITKKTNKKVEQRPIITLDDILKVKLKKTAERSTTPRGKKLTQPLSSTDVLRNVQLRPAKQPQSAGSTKNDGDPTTPSSMLTKILSDTPVRKVKRLKRVSGYSFDDFSRRKQSLKMERERDYT